MTMLMVRASVAAVEAGCEESASNIPGPMGERSQEADAMTTVGSDGTRETAAIWRSRKNLVARLQMDGFGGDRPLSPEAAQEVSKAVAESAKVGVPGTFDARFEAFRDLYAHVTGRLREVAKLTGNIGEAYETDAAIIIALDLFEASVEASREEAGLEVDRRFFLASDRPGGELEEAWEEAVAQAEDLSHDPTGRMWAARLNDRIRDAATAVVAPRVGKGRSDAQAKELVRASFGPGLSGCLHYQAMERDPAVLRAKVCADLWQVALKGFLEGQDLERYPAKIKAFLGQAPDSLSNRGLLDDLYGQIIANAQLVDLGRQGSVARVVRLAVDQQFSSQEVPMGGHHERAKRGRKKDQYDRERDLQSDGEDGFADGEAEPYRPDALKAVPESLSTEEMRDLDARLEAADETLREAIGAIRTRLLDSKDEAHRRAVRILDCVNSDGQINGDAIREVVPGGDSARNTAFRRAYDRLRTELAPMGFLLLEDLPEKPEEIEARELILDMVQITVSAGAALDPAELAEAVEADLAGQPDARAMLESELAGTPVKDLLASAGVRSDKDIPEDDCEELVSKLIVLKQARRCVRRILEREQAAGRRGRTYLFIESPIEPTTNRFLDDIPGFLRCRADDSHPERAHDAAIRNGRVIVAGRRALPIENKAADRAGAYGLIKTLPTPLNKKHNDRWWYLEEGGVGFGGRA